MKRILSLSLAVSLIVGMHSCRNSNLADGSQEHAQELVVVEQSDSVRGTHEANNYYTVNINVDVPTDGPQVLIDSVMALINRELYHFCEYCVHETYTPDIISSRYNENEAFTDAENLLSHSTGR